MMTLGDMPKADVYVGGVKASALYIGDVKVWGDSTPAPAEWTTDPETYNGEVITIRKQIFQGEFVGWEPFAGDESIGVAEGQLDSTRIEWYEGVNCVIDLTATRS